MRGRHADALFEADQLRDPGDEEQQSARREGRVCDRARAVLRVESVELEPADLLGHLGDGRTDRLAVVSEREELGCECRVHLVAAVLPQHPQWRFGTTLERHPETLDVLLRTTADRGDEQ